MDLKNLGKALTYSISISLLLVGVFGSSCSKKQTEVSEGTRSPAQAFEHAERYDSYDGNEIHVYTSYLPRSFWQRSSYALTYPLFSGEEYNYSSYAPKPMNKEQIENNKIAAQLIRKMKCAWIDWNSDSYSVITKKKSIPLKMGNNKKARVCQGAARCDIKILGRRENVEFRAFFEDFACMAKEDGSCPDAASCVRDGSLIEENALDIIFKGRQHQNQNDRNRILRDNFGMPRQAK